MKKLLTSHFTHNLSFNENVDTASRVVNSDFQIHQSDALNSFSWPVLICRFSIIEKIIAYFDASFLFTLLGCCKDLGGSLTKMVMRHRNVDAKLKGLARYNFT